MDVPHLVPPLKPLLHFLVLGALLHAAVSAFSRPGLAPDPAQLDRLRADWLRETGRPPRPEELAASVRRHVEEDALVAQARRLGLDRRDPVVRQRLLMNMRFAFPDLSGEPAVLLARAHELGMDERDLVVRRRLVSLMEQQVTAKIAVTEAEVRAWFDQHAHRFAGDARRTFRHVLLSRDRRGPRARPEAEAMLGRLQEGAPEAGDPFLAGHAFAAASRADLERTFGADFARAIEAAPVRAWSGPYESPYGFHLVRIDAVDPGPAPDYARVRSQAAHALLEERRQAALRAELDRLVADLS